MADPPREVGQDVQAVAESLSRFAKEFLTKAQGEVSRRAVSNQMRRRGKSAAVSAGPVFNNQQGAGTLQIVGGRLERSLQGRGQGGRGLTEGISRIEVSASGARLTFGSAVPYAGIHEHGGSVPVTESMRGFFWYKYMQTESEGWLHLALGAENNDTFRIPARPYLEPALSNALPKIKELGEEVFTDIVAKRLEA